ncbi:hypothetical protein [Candidatus Neptunochlamydia vexilliferae]|uniref:Uncharacterized protein n=1 Tax=Candidatus Neptunichlamydia vexilliferae TaxID=1651774 RepID=A0ABS0B2E7_9BACT|nr:hypothetical protein [Candidatus Neptunochlamydia vexilliferae]MBF5059901.1 hypothetical protein [Candidatus Neptunochlamydia vexilliferae]
MTRQKILSEIDLTLDQLIKNAAALQKVKNDPSCETETEALLDILLSLKEEDSQVV